VNRKRADIPPYSEQDESRYFSMQGAGIEQVFFHAVSRKRAEGSPYSEQDESMDFTRQ
jgi:hypothetical protein